MSPKKKKGRAKANKELTLQEWESKLMMEKPLETTRKSGVYMAPRHSQDEKRPEEGWMPLVSGCPLKQAVARYPASGFVSAIPNCTIPRWWGWLPAREWPRTGLPTRHIRAIRPVEMGAFAFLTHTFAFWAQPAMQMAGLTDDLREQAEAERTEVGRLQSQLLDLKMRREMEEITDEEYERKAKVIELKLEDLREKGPRKAVNRKAPKPKNKKGSREGS